MIDWPFFSALHFLHPERAPLLLGWLVLCVLLVLLERRGTDAIDRLVGIGLQGKLIERPSAWRRWLRLGLLCFSGVAMGLALMQPQMGERYVSTPRVGAEIMIALDVSRSMLADDAKPSRLERSKAEIRDLLSYLGDDYVGLIAFAGRASVLSPMTPDKSFLRLALDSAGPHSVSRGGTRLAEPIRRAVAGLGEPGAAQRALILITDGEDHDSFALDAAKAAAEAGIKIIAIGFGDEGGSPIYVRDPKTGARSQVRDGDGNAVISRLNGDLLRELALATDGAFVPAGTGVLDLASIYDAHISPLTRGQLDERGRTIRDEVYQPFLLAALVSLVAAAFVIRRPRRGGPGSVVSLTSALPILLLGFALSSVGPSLARAQGVAPAEEVVVLGELDEVSQSAEDATSTDSLAVTEAAAPVVEDPRTRFNRANAALAQGDDVTASSLLRSARRDAPDDPELRFAATYNLGLSAVARADKLADSSPKETLSALHEATDWFREAVSQRPAESAPRHNLEVTLRRALILEDEIAKGEEGTIETGLDKLVEAQRGRASTAARLLEAVARSEDEQVTDSLRPAFRDAATDQRVLLAEAEELAERIVREQEALAAKPEESRSPEEALRAAQLDGVLVYLDGAINRMGQTRRQLRQRRAERSYRRASAALGELKRARDQLRDPVQQIGVLLGEVRNLAGATNALAAAQSQAGLATPGSGTQPALPAFLTADSLEEESRRLENRVRDLGVRLEQAAMDAAASANAPPPDPGAGPGAGAPSESERAALREALQVAAPQVGQAGGAMESATLSIGSEGYAEALEFEVEAGRLLGEAQEAFFDLRQLLDVAHADESRLAEFASFDVSEVAQTTGDGEEEAVGEIEAAERAEALRGQRIEFAPLFKDLQEKNLARAARLGELLKEERARRLEEVSAAASGGAAGGPGPDPATIDPTTGMPSEDEGGVDPLTQENQRFDLAEAMLAGAVVGMEEARLALGGADPSRLVWEEVAQGSGVARDRLAELQSLFFTLVEHLEKLARDQTDLNDRTQDAIALASSSLAEDDAARGPETRARTGELTGEQTSLAARARILADAMVSQADAMAADPAAAEAAAAGPEQEAPQDRMRRAAEHIALSELAMGTARETLANDDVPLAPVPPAQAEAVQEIAKALELLSPPPPPQEEPENQDSEDQDQEEQEQEEGDEGESSPEESEPGQDETAEASENEASPEEEAAEDPSDLLQGVRDREAERRRDQERDQQSRRSQPVDRDW